MLTRSAIMFQCFWPESRRVSELQRPQFSIMAKKGNPAAKRKAAAAPKANARAAADAVADAVAAAAANPDAAAAEPNVMAKPLQIVEDVNGQHLQKLEDSIQTVLGHHLFQNIMHETPLKIDKDASAHECGMQAGFVEQMPFLTPLEGGTADARSWLNSLEQICRYALNRRARLPPAPWDPDEHESALSRSKTYVSAGNLFWCNLRHLTSPSVPLSEKSLELQFNYYQGTGPEKLREEIVIAVEDGMSAEQFHRDQVQGKLKRISPEELDHSLVMYIAELIKMGGCDCSSLPGAHSCWALQGVRPIGQWNHWRAAHPPTSTSC
eukprot:s1005_g29.t1